MASKLNANILKKEQRKYTKDYFEEEEYSFRSGEGCADAEFTKNREATRTKPSNMFCYSLTMRKPSIVGIEM
jgi:hypothetical protein